jgi:hypothetical protein
MRRGRRNGDFIRLRGPACSQQHDERGDFRWETPPHRQSLH